MNKLKLTPEPQKKLTKDFLLENMSKPILKFSKAIYNKTPSPHPINFNKKSLEAKRLNKFKSSKEHERKFTQEGVQILNLPRLPYGHHLNYEEPNFLQKHFVSKSIATPNLEDLKNFEKQYRFQRKRLRKSVRPSKYSATFTNNLQKYFIFKQGAGDLKCDISNSIIKEYEKQKFKFKPVPFDQLTPTSGKSVKNTTFTIEEIGRVLSPSVHP